MQQPFLPSGKFFTIVRQTFPASGKYVAGVQEAFVVISKACRTGAGTFREENLKL
ncbi:hypothetical protein OUO26_08750 [Chryseobacterium sp. CY350]|uniref:hypothetical protein n=1 Tax=Chryseobacterium sp. CY350 TaxID=2997336 RepID=UPI0022703012|nr:hypothetical protein [Chryseobacterium sp. CY350]MCY0977432.1 hypothetical protein [Chryseobacterium sp. CY350]